MRLTTATVLLLLAGTATAQVKAPPPPAKYHVDIRYRIEADRDGRVIRFRAMMAELAALGFVADPREDSDLDILDPNADRLAGTIASSKVEQLLKTIAVQTVLVQPDGTSLGEDLAKPVHVSLKLASGLDPITQRRLHEQAIDQLTKLGFRPAIGYDDSNFSRIRGTVPAGQVMNLLKDLRGLPAGVLLQALPRQKLPQPLASLLPIKLIEVLPDLEMIPPATLPPSASAKYSSGLRSALADPAFSSKPMRVEAAVAGALATDRSYRVELNSKIPGIMPEGNVGMLVTFHVPTVKDLERLAARPEIMALRLPPMATNTIRNWTNSGGDALSATHIPDLQKQGYRGAGQKVVVIGGGFDRAAADLPKNAIYLDLTAELSPSLDPMPANPLFDATAAAIAAHRAAPQATLIMVRIDPSAFHQLFTVAHAALGDLTLSPAQVARAELLLSDYEVLNRRRDYVSAEYTEAFANLSDDEKPRTRREKAQADYLKLKADEAAFRVMYDKLQVIRKGLEAIHGAAAIANTLTWDDGYPADGLSEFSQFLDEKFAPGVRRVQKASRLPTWVQAASESTWSVWAGPAHDTDGDRVMDFAEANTPLPKGTWTRDLNFLATLKADGTLAADLPAGTKLRLAIQWREPHDPTIPLTVEPLVGFTLQLLRQYDPTGTKTASDELTEVASSEGAPVRLMKTPAAGVYEQTLDVTVPSAGRYALRVVMTPTTASRFASETRIGEITPKITVKPMNATTDRVIFHTFMASHAGVGVPGDATGAFTVGRCDSSGRSLSLLGAGPGLQLRSKPDALMFGDGIGGTGSGVSAGTMAGLAADFAELNVRPAQLIGTAAIQPNGMLVLPLEWIATMPAKP